MSNKNSVLSPRNSYIEQIKPFIDKPVVKVITGMRRTGKSTFLQLLIEHLVSTGVEQKRVVYINMESLDNLKYTDLKELHTLVKSRKKQCSQKVYLLIDEIQEIPQWERLINSFLSESDADIYITGSNSKMLSGELASLLTGRYIEFRIYPLVFTEFQQFRNETDVNQQFNEFLVYGGLPGIHNLDFQKSVIYQYLSSIKDSVVLKDVILRNKIRDVHILEKILLYVMDNIGNLFSGRKVADFFKKERRNISIETVYNYIQYLESALIIHRVPRYDIKGKKLLETNEKYYVTDLGIRHALLGYKEKDINAYLENIIYIELKKRGYTVYIGKLDDYEIDFIGERNDEKIYIQVCYLLSNQDVWKREKRPFFGVKDNYPKYILSMDSIPEGNEDGIIRKYIPSFCAERSL